LDADNSTVVNLFGEEVYALPRLRGRPAFERTEENANKVMMLLAMGWSNERIAGAVVDPRTGKSISAPTLKRHFRAELQVRKVARDRLNATQLMQAFTAATAGNVGAMRFFEQLVQRNDMMFAEQIVGSKGADDNKPSQGKKELIAELAHDADDALSLQLDAEARDSVH
jgi:hypothetical protein